MAFVTTLFVLTTTGAGETIVQTAGGSRLVVDCNVKPATLVGHAKITLVAERRMDSCGVNEMLNTVPLPKLPPLPVIP